ncbi:MAG: metal-dependent protein hydrolase [Parcubacteria group bacterium]|nr:metal-dependent protein hydrolase [Parcubacteria group bacterium]
MKTIVTHSGMFHIDEVFAVATVLLVYPDAKVIRSRDMEVIKAADIAIDVGMEYDSESLRFDHHQEGGADVRPNGIPYASFGLVWREYGFRLARDGKDIIEEKLVIPIDGPDNGVSIYEPKFEGIEPYTIRDFIYSFLSYDDRSENRINEAFMSAVEQAKGVLEREITKAEERAIGMKEVRKIYDSAVDKRIIVLDKDLPWEPVLAPTPEAMFVVYPRKEGNWGTKGVPVKNFGFERKKLFPYAWVGKSAKELAKVTGVPDACFCHNGRFITTANSKEGAMKLAEIALNA